MQQRRVRHAAEACSGQNLALVTWQSRRRVTASQCPLRRGLIPAGGGVGVLQAFSSHKQPDFFFFYCPDKMSSRDNCDMQSPPFSCPLQQHCKGPERKITHPISHTAPCLSLCPKCILWTSPPPQPPPVHCRWVKYYIKAPLMFHSASHVSPQYRVQN